MSASLRGSLARPVRQTSRAVAPLTLSVAMTLTIPGLAQAQPKPEPNTLAALVADVAEANQRLEEIGARVQIEQESVNKAIVEVQEAREAAAAAQHQVDASHQEVEQATAAISDAQRRFDTFAAAAYVNGPSASLVMARTPEDLIATSTAGQALAISSQQVMNGLRRAQTEVVNKDSAARLAKQKADEAVDGAQHSQDAAVEALTRAQATFREQQAEIDRVAAERQAAQRKLELVRQQSAPATPGAAWTSGPISGPISKEAGSLPQAAAPAVPGTGDRWDPAAGVGPAASVKVPYGKPSEWDLTLPAIPSAFLSGDPVQIINAVLQIAMNSMQVTQDLGKQFLQKLGILKPTDTGITNGGGIPLVYGNQAIEYVIRRAQSQIGVPYSWGGGNAAGPSRGIDSGANTVGFDCSGLVLYAFAGAGIKLPHYSGSQYNMGRKIPSAQMRRGDVIFWGPGGSQHVAIFLGNGQMIEAPYTGSFVKLSPVRTSGMTPFVVRYIEW
ncbi:MAG: NlpC/P60 family peptidoglycan endopeptidase RipA [Mycobacterium sp.]|nr:NlpC/P60 family peptidoglycan endopeptidase RipA [Mycobacterium sp.]